MSSSLNKYLFRFLYKSSIILLMKRLDLSKALKPYTHGWVAINDLTGKIVAHAKDFNSITKKVKKNRNISLLPASDNYFGIIT